MEQSGSCEEAPLVIAIAIYPGFTALDAIGPYEVLNALPNATLCFVSHSHGLVPSDSGLLSLMATASFEEVPHPHVIVVPGGPGTSHFLHDHTFLTWIQKAHESTIFTTSVCTGSLLLAAAGLLHGLPATTHWSVYDDLSKLGALPTEQRVVQQGKIITAAGVSSGIDMAIKLASLLRDEETAKMLQLFLEYDPQPPYDVGSPSKAGEVLVEKTRQFVAKRRASLNFRHKHGQFQADAN